MESQLSAFQIVENCLAVKQQLRALSADGTKRIKYVIYYQNPTTGTDWQQYTSGDTKVNSFEQFDTALDYVTQQLKNAIRVQIVFMDSHGKRLADPIIPLLSIANSVAAPQVRSVEPSADGQVADMPVVGSEQSRTGSGNSFGSNVSGILGLLGFGGLSGDDDSPMGALGAIMQVRDGLKDAQYERKELMGKYEDAISERTQLRDKVSSLETSLQAKERELDGLQQRNEDLEDEIDDLRAELQKRETLTGFGSLAIQKLASNIIKRNPTKVSRLLGMSAEDMLGMIDGAEEVEPDTVQQDIPQVEVEDDSPRNVELKRFTDFAKGLSDDDFATLSTILQVFENNSQTISIVMGMMQHAGHNMEK